MNPNSLSNIVLLCEQAAARGEVGKIKQLCKTLETRANKLDEVAKRNRAAAWRKALTREGANDSPQGKALSRLAFSWVKGDALAASSKYAVTYFERILARFPDEVVPGHQQTQDASGLWQGATQP